jgi:hypothetical protein
VLTFPFFTLENVDAVDDLHIVVGGGNNLPLNLRGRSRVRCARQDARLHPR